MKRSFAAILSLILTLLCLIPAAGLSAPAKEAAVREIPALLQAAPYMEGSVIAGFRNMTEADLSGAFDPSSGLRAEALMEVSPESLGLAGEEGTVLLAEVSSGTLTTEALLYLLAEDPRVACAKPNYLAEPGDDGDGNEGERDEEPAQPLTPHDQIPLLSQFQWYLSDQSNLRDVPLDGQEPHSSVNAVPSISDLDGSAPNMTGAPVYVAVIDEFADWRNPDLQPVMIRFTDAEQAALGCGEWGYNATDYKGGGQSPDNGEACADMAGVKVALRVAAKKENFDYDVFFRSYAHIWLTKYTLQRVYSRFKDEHPMPYLRINATLQQFDEFLDFYGITEGDGMYLAPEDRVSVW